MSVAMDHESTASQSSIECKRLPQPQSIVKAWGTGSEESLVALA